MQKNEKILKENLKQLAEKLDLRFCFIFQYYNNLNHTSILVKNSLQKPKVSDTCWLPQSFDINFIENLWSELTTRVHVRRPSQVLERFIKDKQAGIAVETCLKLGENCTQYLQTVVQQKELHH